MKKPKFDHDCPRCRFIGHVYQHDVYLCDGAIDFPVLGETIIGRYGSKPEEYASCSSSLWRDMLRGNIDVKGKVMPFADYLFSPEVLSYHQAWLLALAVYDWKKESAAG